MYFPATPVLVFLILVTMVAFQTSCSAVAPAEAASAPAPLPPAPDGREQTIRIKPYPKREAYLWTYHGTIQTTNLRGVRDPEYLKDQYLRTFRDQMQGDLEKLTESGEYGKDKKEVIERINERLFAAVIKEMRQMAVRWFRRDADKIKQMTDDEYFEYSLRAPFLQPSFHDDVLFTATYADDYEEANVSEWTSFQYQLPSGRHVFAFYCTYLRCSVFLIYNLGDEVHSRTGLERQSSDGMLEAWLLRDEKYEDRLRPFDVVRWGQFMGLSQNERSGQPGTFRLEGSIRVRHEGEVVKELEIDLQTAEPLAIFEAYLTGLEQSARLDLKTQEKKFERMNAKGIEPSPKELLGLARASNEVAWIEQRQAKDKLYPATIQGRVSSMWMSKKSGPVTQAIRRIIKNLP